MFHCNNSPISTLRVGLIQALGSMTKIIATLASILFLLGCNGPAKSPYATISVTETDGAGRKVRELKFALTDRQAKTCISGDWKEAKALADERQYTKSPAYIWRNGQLEILLVNSMCDSYSSYIGSVSEGVFRGEHVVYGLGSGNSVGVVSGAYSKP